MAYEAAADAANRVVDLFNSNDRAAAGTAAAEWFAAHADIQPIPAALHPIAHTIAEIAAHSNRPDVVQAIHDAAYDAEADTRMREECNRLIGLMNDRRYDDARELLQAHVTQYWSAETIVAGGFDLIKVLRFNALVLEMPALLVPLDRTYYRLRLFGWALARRAGEQLLLIPNLAPVKLHSEGDCHTCEDLDCAGIYEPTSLELWAALSARADLVVDIGAHVGAFALVAAAANPDVPIHAFEALPDAIDRMTRNIAINEAETVVLHRAAVSDAEGTAEFRYLRRKPNGHICRVGALDETRESYSVISVEKATLDGALPPTPEKRLLVKIDTEGHEAHVVAGLAGWLATSEVDLIIESFYPDICREIAERLTSMGYRYYRILEGDHRLVPLETFTPARNRSLHNFNTLCTRRTPEDLAGLLPAPCRLADA